MTKPAITQKGPFVVDLKPGTYWWCACGRSKNQPFCDGSHKGSEFALVKFKLSEAQSVALCGCKHTDKPPFCNGLHNRL